MRLLSWVTAINVLVAAGFSLIGLFAPHSILPPGAQVTEATNIFAYYAAAQTIFSPALVIAVLQSYAVFAFLQSQPKQTNL